MKKLRLLKDTELKISKGVADCYCDFCGEPGVVFTSSFDDRPDGDERKCEMQICVDCVCQLAKHI